jgi:hypothetical protein
MAVDPPRRRGGATRRRPRRLPPVCRLGGHLRAGRSGGGRRSGSAAAHPPAAHARAERVRAIAGAGSAWRVASAGVPRRSYCRRMGRPLDLLFSILITLTYFVPCAILPPAFRRGLALSPTCFRGKVVSRKGMWPRNGKCSGARLSLWNRHRRALWPFFRTSAAASC